MYNILTGMVPGDESPGGQNFAHQSWQGGVFHYLDSFKARRLRPFHLDNQLWSIINWLSVLFLSELIFLVCTTIPGNEHYVPRSEYLALVDNLHVIYPYRILCCCIPNMIFPGKIQIILGFLGIVTSPSKANNLNWNFLCISTPQKLSTGNS